MTDADNYTQGLCIWCSFGVVVIIIESFGDESMSIRDSRQMKIYALEAVSVGAIYFELVMMTDIMYAK